MRIYVITLADALKRQQHATSQLQAFALEFEFFPAVSGADALRSQSVEVKEHDFLLSTGRHITNGEVGCYVSHRMLWKLCAQSEEPIVVMEDDFELSSDFPHAIRHLENEISEYGFIRLQSERRASKRRVKSMGRFVLWRYTKAPNSAMCYGLSPAAARRLLAHADTISAPVDIYMKRFWYHGQTMYGISPYSVTESQLSSDTQISGRVKAKKNFVTRMRRLFARLREFFTRTGFNFRGRIPAVGTEDVRATKEQADRTSA